jgi:hypothetical protein
MQIKRCWKGKVLISYVYFFKSEKDLTLERKHNFLHYKKKIAIRLFLFSMMNIHNIRCFPNILEIFCECFRVHFHDFHSPIICIILIQIIERFM